jgi:hypothetical protein
VSFLPSFFAFAFSPALVVLSFCLVFVWLCSFGFVVIFSLPLTRLVFFCLVVVSSLHVLFCLCLSPYLYRKRPEIYNFDVPPPPPLFKISLAGGKSQTKAKNTDSPFWWVFKSDGLYPLPPLPFCFPPPLPTTERMTEESLIPSNTFPTNTFPSVFVLVFVFAFVFVLVFVFLSLSFCLCLIFGVGVLAAYLQSLILTLTLTMTLILTLTHILTLTLNLTLNLTQTLNPILKSTLNPP